MEEEKKMEVQEAQHLALMAAILKAGVLAHPENAVQPDKNYVEAAQDLLDTAHNLYL
jgi:hypothetical protein